jgi:hypothetical protein
MLAGFLPVSIEVLVATFVMRPERRLPAARRWALVSMSGFFGTSVS